MSIHYQKKSQFYCEDCQKIVRGEGYLIYRKAYCVKHYVEKFPKFKKKENNEKD